MDIEVIIKKTLVFAGLFIASYAVIAGFASVSSVFLEKYINNRWISLMPSVFIIVLILRPLELFLAGVTDRFLFQKKYDYRELLKTFTAEVLGVIDIDVLAELTVNKLADIIKLKNVAVLLYDKDDDVYRLEASRGVLEDEVFVMRNSGQLARIIYDRDFMYPDENIFGTDLDALVPEVIIPLIRHKEILGLLVLGPKMSDDDFTQDDLDILTPLAGSISLAIENTRVRRELVEKKKKAALGKLASGLSHNINNHLARASTKLQHVVYTSGLLETLRDPGLDPVERKKKAAQLRRLLEEAEEYVETAGVVIRKTRDFFKEENLVDRPVAATDIKPVLDRALHMVSELKLNKGPEIDISVDIPDNMYRVRANQNDLLEIMISLIDNAVDAVHMRQEKEGSDSPGKITIKAFRQDTVIGLQIIDTGIGIPEDELDIIFMPYYTTKTSEVLYEKYVERKKLDYRLKSEVVGTGLGLDLVKTILDERIKGSISVESTPGKGTTFNLLLPSA